MRHNVKKVTSAVLTAMILMSSVCQQGFQNSNAAETEETELQAIWAGRENDVAEKSGGQNTVNNISGDNAGLDTAINSAENNTEEGTMNNTDVNNAEQEGADHTDGSNAGQEDANHTTDNKDGGDSAILDEPVQSEGDDTPGIAEETNNTEQAAADENIEDTDTDIQDEKTGVSVDGSEAVDSNGRVFLLEKGEKKALKVSAFNYLDVNANVKLYFWDFKGRLPEDREYWSSVLTKPCMGITVSNEDGDSLIDVKYNNADGAMWSADACILQDKNEGNVTARYLSAELLAGMDAEFEVILCCETADDVVVTPCIEYDGKRDYFDAWYLSWAEAETEESAKESENETEESAMESENETEESVTDTKAETEGAVESETETEEMETVTEEESETEEKDDKIPGSERDISGLEPSDFSSCRLVVLADTPSVIIDKENLAAQYGKLYLLQYDTAEDAMHAYLYYRDAARAVEPDTVLQTADGQNNAIAALSDEQNFPVVQRMEGVIALVDTGAGDGPNIIDRISLIDDTLEGSNSHADRMVSAIVEQNPGAGILSIRAMDDNGFGTVSSIVAAMEYAINQRVSIINLSLYAKTNLSNAVLESEIKKAVDMGIIVVGAAGNDSADVGGYMPGAVESAWIIGASDQNGNRTHNTNYGRTVDYYVVAESTSEAAAIFSGYISAYGINATQDILNKGLIYSPDYVQKMTDDTTLSEEESDEDTSAFKLAEPTKFTIHDGSPAWAPAGLRSGKASSHKRTVTFAGSSEKKWAYCLEPLKGPPVHEKAYQISSAKRLGASDNIAKALYYLYGGPAWGKNVNGVNLKKIMTDAGCRSGNNYYAMTHYVVAYFYLGGDASKWNAHPAGPGVLNAKGVKLVKTLVDHIKDMPGTDEAKATISPETAKADFDGTKYVSPSFTYSTFSGNTGKIKLPANVSLVNETTGAVTSSGTAVIDGGNVFHLEAKVSPGSQQNYTLNCAAVRDFTAYRKVFTGADQQDMGFAHFTSDKSTSFSVNWPVGNDKWSVRVNAKKVNETQNGLSGAVFGVYADAGCSTPKGNLTSGSGGRTNILTVDIPEEQDTVTLYCKEISAPGGYTPTNEVFSLTFTKTRYEELKEAGDISGELQSFGPAGGIVNEKSPLPEGAGVFVKKTSTAADEILELDSYSLEGAEFVVSGGGYSNTLITDETGVSNSISLPDNSWYEYPDPVYDKDGNYLYTPDPILHPVTTTYTVRETKAPKGHKQNTGTKQFTVTMPYDRDKTIEVAFEDEPIFCNSNLNIEKLGVKGNPISGIVFKVEYFDAASADADRLKKTWYLETDESGKIYMDEAHKTSRPEFMSDEFYMHRGSIVLPINGYLQVTEVAAPAEYVMDDTPTGFPTGENAKYEKRIYNDMEPCKIWLQKYDTDGGTPLSGVEFELKYLEETIVSNENKAPAFKRLLSVGESIVRSTDDDGMIFFDNLDHGIYQLTEIRTAPGHTLLKEPVIVTLPMQMTDEEADEYGNVDFDSAKKDEGYTDMWFFYDCLYEITNSIKFVMPMSGGSGTWKYGILGMGILVAAGVCWLVRDAGSGRKRKRSI